MPFLTPTGTAENSDYINAVFLPVHILGSIILNL